MRARVIDPDGTVHWLNRKTITDSTGENDQHRTLNNEHVLSAPLPNLTPGAIVECLITLHERRLHFAAGWTHMILMSRFQTAVLHTRLDISLPAKQHLQKQTVSLPSMITRRYRRGDRQHYIFRYGYLAPQKLPAHWTPSAAQTWPRLSFSTGNSWQAIATAYARIVNREIGSGNPALANFIRAAERSTDPDATPMARIAAIVAWLQDRVRYTGIEFNQAGIIPNPPTETLAHGYGDCKDKATLLVALLRQANFTAHVALLTPQDRTLDLGIPTRVPGLGVFSHAIVIANLPNGQPLWIDATDRYLPIGQYPAVDQMRQALIISRHTTGLILTPSSPAQANRLVEQRIFRLHEQGGAHVTEINRTWGQIGGQYRQLFSTLNFNIRKGLHRYFRENYLCKMPPTITNLPATNLRQPYQLTLSGSPCKRGNSNGIDAMVTIWPENMMRRLPSQLHPTGKGVRQKPPKAPLLLPYVFHIAWHYRIIPAPGFRALPLPRNQKIAMGPTVYRRQFRLGKSGIVHARFSFDTGNQRLLSPAQITAIRQGIKKLHAQGWVKIKFEQSGIAALQAGNLSGALQTFRSLERREPQQAWFHLLMAKALIAAGQGAEAVREARKATQLAPQSARTWATAALIYEHDSTGVAYGPFYHRQRAIAAFQQALRLKPQNVLNRLHYALLLEHGPHGKRYSPGANLSEAVRQYQKVKRTQLKTYGIPNNIDYDLAYSRQWKALAKYAAGQPVSKITVAFQLAAQSVISNPQTAIASLESELTPTEWNHALGIGATILILTRHYRRAAALKTAAAADNKRPAQLLASATFLATVKRQSLKPLPETTPWAAYYNYELAYDIPDNHIDLKNVLSKYKYVYKGQSDDPYGRFDTWDTEWQSTQPAAVDFDSRLAGEQYTTHRLTADLTRLNLHLQSGDEHIYAAREHGMWRLVSLGYANDQNDELAIGGEALHQIHAGHPKAARKLIQRFMSDIPHFAHDPAYNSPASFIWRPHKKNNAKTLRLTAAIMATNRKHAAIAPWERREHHNGGKRKLAIRLLLTYLYAYQNHPHKLAALTKKLLHKFHHSRYLTFRRCYALYAIRQYATCARLASDWLQQPHHTGPLSYRIWYALILSQLRLGQPKAAAQDIRHWLSQSTSKKNASDWNDAAWLSLFGADTMQDGLQRAAHAEQLAPSNNDILQTLAGLEAASGNNHAALSILHQYMLAVNDARPESGDWCVLGLIARNLGLNRDARIDFTHLKKPQHIRLAANYYLAQMQLHQLPEAPAPVIVASKSKH